jgi:hypothetical protein
MNLSDEILKLAYTSDGPERINTLRKLALKAKNFEDFAVDCRDNYDCDEGAHGTHSPHCRACKAKVIMPKPMPEPDNISIDKEIIAEQEALIVKQAINELYLEADEEFTDKSTGFVLEITMQRARSQGIKKDCEIDDVLEAISGK